MVQLEACKSLVCDLCGREDEGVKISKWHGLISISVCEKCLRDFFLELGND